MPSILGKAASAGKAVAKKLATENMRKYVWYDYSIVEKARIQIIGSREQIIGSCIPGQGGGLFVDKEIPVQINPETLSYSHHVGVNTVINRINRNEVGSCLRSFGELERDSFEIPELIFDIYDEYNARSMNGTMTKNFSLMDKNATALPTLVEAAKSANRYARFIWGDMEKFGLLTGITVRYFVFSPWGQPLKAGVTLSLAELNFEEPLPIEGGTGKLANTGKKVLNGVKNVFR